ncbi:MAG: GntR family transcriptional regulator [Rubrivivax sp.]|nr:GntR family transcriptional regulator [Rubrivivax sp.]
MNHPLRLERPQLLTELAYLRIREAIVNGELKLGEQVSEAQLAAGMAVSKTPVREALLRLKVEGLVEISPQRGTFVFVLGPEQVSDLCRYRAMVEAEALREAAEAQPKALVDAMARRVAEMRKAERAKDMRALARIDMEFHWQFFVHSPNEYLRAGYEVIRGRLVALRHRSPITNAVSSHQVLVDAVGGGDIDAACALLREHVFENEPRYRAACGKA